MLNVMRNVCEVGASRLDLFHVLKRLVDPEMRGMFLKAQAIKDQHIEIRHFIQRVLGYETQVGNIGKIIEAITHYRKSPVNNLEWCDLELLSEAKAC